MAFIKTIQESEAGPELKDVYEEVKQKRGKLSNILSVQSLNPSALKAHSDLYMSVMFNNSNISRELKEMLAVVVSVSNKCSYCINHHVEALKTYWKDEAKLQLFVKDFRIVAKEPATIAALEYAEKLTTSQEQIRKSDIDKLREYGYDDPDILNINLIISYFNFVNRIASGLGVEFTDDEVGGYKY